MDQEEKQSKINDYILQKTLGQGLNSKVKLGMNEKTGIQYAIKMAKIKENAEGNIATLINEHKILLELDHPNIIKIIEMSDNGEYKNSNGKKRSGVFFAVLELASNGEIFEYLNTCGKFPEAICRYLFKQQIEAMFYIHNKGLCHRDLKPENLFFDKDFNLKVADFGFAACLSGKQGDGKLTTILGSDAYMAPELNMMQDSYKGIPIDLFSCAVILYIFMTGAPCFKAAKPEDPNYKLLCTNKHVLFWKQNMQKRQMAFKKEFIDLMNAMLAFDPLNRPTIPEIQSHVWLKGQTATHEQVKEYFTKCKVAVDDALEQQKIQEDNQKMQKKQAQASMQNLAFGDMFKAKRGHDDDPELLLKKAEIESRLKQVDFEKYKFGLTDIKESRKPSVLVSGLDARKLLEIQFFCTSEVCENFDYDLNKGKFSMTKNFDGVNVKIGMKIYETQNGLKIVEFMKRNGPSHHYNDFCKQFKDQFVQITEE